MYPRLFELGPITVYTYGLLLAMAYLGGLQLALIRGKQRGLDPARIMDLGIWIIVSALVGAKAMLLLVEWNYFSQHPGELISLAQSGGVFYGGLILAVAVALWYLWRHKMPMWTVCDVFAPGIAFGHVVGRLGCFFAGCCYGTATTLPWGITFHDQFAHANVGTPLDIALHPTQIYEAGAELLILIFLLVTEKRGRPFAGRTFWTYMFLYGVSRFIVEIYRGDPRGSVFGGALSTSQFISVLLVPLSLIMLVILSRRAPSPDASTRAGIVGAAA
jgi:phosphatidylglycerol---prolipoprotein diacylglyceryl transferase